MASVARFISISLLLALAPQARAQAGSAEGFGEPMAPTNTGRIAGKVIAVGEFKQPKPLPVFKNRSFCGTAVANETLVVGNGGALRNAVITLHPAARAVRPEPAPLVLDNQKCAFTPHIQAAVVGSELLLKNSDPILHTVHARLGKETLFNVGLPRWRQVTKRLDRAGVVRIDCDVLHTWMSAAIVVTDTPHFAVTDTHGRFVIESLPAGRYQANIWHEKLGLKTTPVTVTADHAVALDVFYAVTQNDK
jgi:hypothetical protein